MNRIIKLLIAMSILFASVAFFGACTKESAGPESAGGVITVINQSSWDGAEALEFYDLTGKKFAQAPIKSGRASVDFGKGGTYIVQVKDAPESVNYGYAEAPDQEIKGLVVISSEREKAELPILKIVDSEEGDDGIKKFRVGVLILESGVPAPGYPVQLCYEPKGMIGYCLDPTPTDENGFFMGIANAGVFHLIVYSKDRKTTVYDGKDNLSASRRFIVAEIGEG